MPWPKDQDGLTVKQREFVRQYHIHNGNGTQAAIAVGYSPDTAKEMAYENLTKPHIAKALALQSEESERETGVTLAWVIQELKATYDETRGTKAHNAAIRCLELLGKQMEGFTDKLQIEHTAPETPYAGLNPDQLKALIQITDRMTPEEIGAMIDEQLGVIEGKGH